MTLQRISRGKRETELNARRSCEVGRRRSRRLLGACLMATALTAAACGSGGNSGGSGGSGGSDITLNAILPLTGAKALTGVEEKTALQLAVDAVNKQGGIKGHKVKLDIVDFASTTSTGVAAASRVIRNGAKIVFLGGTSADIIPMLKLGKPDSPLIFALSPIIEPSAYPNSNMVFIPGEPRPPEVLQDSLNYFMDQGLTKIAFVYPTDATGQGGYKTMQDIVKKPPYAGHIDLVDVETFEPTATGVSTQMTSVRSSGAQALIIYSSGAPTGVAFKGMASAGLTALPTVVQSSNEDPALLGQFGNSVPDTLLFASSLFYCGNQGLTKDQIKPLNDLRSAYKSSKEAPSTGAALAWDPVQLAITALQHKGADASAKDLATYISSLHDYAGIETTYHFTPTDHVGTSPDSYRMCRWVPSSKTFKPVSDFGGHKTQ